jgi:hypothetical protein
VDEATLEIISVVASANDVSDAEALPDLLQDAPGEIKQLSADSANATTRSSVHGAKAAIPRKGANINRRIVNQLYSHSNEFSYSMVCLANRTAARKKGSSLSQAERL